MKREELETMKVVELKEESRKRGLKLESKRHKFKKAELIKNIMKYDEEQEEQKEMEEQETKQIKFATTLEEILQKYGHRKKDKIYNNELEVGSFVIFLHYVEARNGNIYKKLRTAKVIEIDREMEMVRVKTLLGTEKVLSFEELLYIRKNQRGCTYPTDLNTYLKNQRTEKGRRIMDERFAEGTSTNKR